MLTEPTRTAAVCTLFEGDYHLGLGALVNSLVRHGFTGRVYAGYRGMLPPWARMETRMEPGQWARVNDQVEICFISIPNKAFMAHMKPEFMLQVWREYCPDVDALFYFDPDICVTGRWSFYLEWASCGAAVCEDLNSPLFSTHPVRVQWKQICADRGIPVRRDLDVYVNSGFLGVVREHQEFLHAWAGIQLVMGEFIDMDKPIWAYNDRTFVFGRSDQDALNIALMTAESPISVIGKEGMSFEPGGYTMAHAATRQKPWRKRFLLSSLKGAPPGRADKEFLANLAEPIAVCSPGRRWLLRADARAASAVGRFIRRA
jgi:hypothetical protein